MIASTGFSSRVSLSAPATVEWAKIVSKRLGLRYVELSSTLGNDNVKLVRKAMSSFGLRPVTMHAPSANENDIGNLDDRLRLFAVTSHKQYLRYCRELDVGCYVIHPGGLIYGNWDEDHQVGSMPKDSRLLERIHKANVMSLTQLASFGSQMEVSLALENGSIYDIPYSEVIALVDEAGRDNLGFCADTGHANVGMLAKPGDVVREMGARLRAIHLHDNNGKGDQHLPLGEGNIDWTDVLGALNEVSYRGSLTLEIPKKNHDLVEYLASIRKSIALLEQLADRV